MTRSIYRLGAELLAVRHFVEAHPEHAGLYHALQAMTSAVEVGGLRTRPPGAPDDVFLAEIALGILCRGWPTLNSPNVEGQLLEQYAGSLRLRMLTVPGSDPPVVWQLSGSEADGAETAGALARALFPRDGRLSRWPAATAPKEDSKAEARFHDCLLPQLLGPLAACVEWQRPLETMVEDPDAQSKVANQRADFALDLPGAGDGSAHLRINFEVDGPAHEAWAQKAADEARDKVLVYAGWLQPERIPVASLTETWQPSTPTAHALATHPVVQAARALLEEQALDVAARALLLAPHALARMQLGVLLALRNRGLSLAGGPWRILVREREVPAARLALADLRELLGHLCTLYGLPAVPDIHLTIEADFPGAQGTNDSAPLDDGKGLQVTYAAAGASAPREFNVALDVSVSCRPNQWYGDEWEGDGWLRLRTAFRREGAATLSWSPPRAIANPRHHDESLRYVLGVCFRKPSFRDGQLPIIERALRRQSVIGLLPTGAGKSLTYQLPALLTPGVTFVIDPIKSLMQDQVDNLREAGIDSAVTINSDQTPSEKAAAEWRLGEGSRRFAFISPERLQIQGFRDTLTTLCGNTPVAFAVVDETHCVSEWGHDFRTAYLNLGRHVREFMVHNGTPPPIIALTGTASRAVLIDVQREIAISDPEAIIEPDKFDRPELHFVIEKVDSAEKRATIVSMLSELPGKLEERGYPCEEHALTNGEAAGILFCPHVNGGYGVHALHSYIAAIEAWEEQVGYYGGKKPDAFVGKEEEWIAHKARTQRQFKRNELSLLAATSAFGMGIDKPNIRYTIHLGMPQSTEALMQEMGRAGRDRQPAICHIIFSDREDPDVSDPLHRGIPVEDARQRMNAIGKDHADDAGRMLFLHSLGYHGAAREAVDIMLYIKKYVEPEWLKQSIKSSDLTIPADIKDISEYLKKEAEKRLRHAKASGSNVQTDRGEINDAYYNPGIATEFDRIVYRLTLLGVVTDYTVNYGAPVESQHRLTLARISDIDVMQRLHVYVRRYRGPDYLDEIDSRVESAEGDSVLERVVTVLCDFVYEEIEKQRREAIWNVRQLLRSAESHSDLQRLLANYFDRSGFRPLVLGLLNPTEAEVGWKDIVQDVRTDEEASQLLAQARRTLESATDSTDLHLLAAIALAASAQPDAALSAEDLLLGLATECRIRPEQSALTISNAMDELQRLAPSQVAPVVSAAVSSRDESVPGAIDAAETVALAALPRMAEPGVRQQCAQAIVRRLRRSFADSAESGAAANRSALTSLQAGPPEQVDGSVQAILQEFRASDPPGHAASAAHGAFAASAFRHVRDDALKRRCATLILRDLHQSVQQIV
ncbi:MAG: DEAD/DEAH box helicase [Thermomicrobiales bacterium]